MKKVLASVLALALLFGCASTATRTIETTEYTDGTINKVDTFEGLSDTMVYHDSVARFKEADARRIEAQVKEINSRNTDDLSPDAKAIIEFHKGTQIASIAPDKYGGEKPTEWTDVAHAATGHIGQVVGGAVAITGIREGRKMIEAVTANSGDEMVISGDGNQVDKRSVNQKTIATSGNGNATANSGSNTTEGSKGAVGGISLPTADLETCRANGATMGETAVCLEGLGHDVDITGGIMSINGVKLEETW